MSIPLVKSDDRRGKIQEKLLPSYHSAWMAHWTPTNCKSAKQSDDWASPSYKLSQDNITLTRCLPSGQEIESDSSKVIGGVREVTKDEMINFMDGNLKSSHDPNGESSSQHEGNVRSQINHLPVLDLSLSKATDAWTPNSESKLRKSPLLEQTTESSDQQANFQRSNNLLAGPKSFQDESFASSSKIVPLESGSRFPMLPPFCQQDHTIQPSSTILVHVMKMNSTAAICDPSTSKIQQGDDVGQQLKNIKNCSDTQLFPSKFVTSHAGDLRKLYHEAYSVPRLSSSVDGVETMRMNTTIDATEAFPIGHPKFSQTTHHFLITEKTDLSVSDGGEIFRESTFSRKLKGKAVSEFLSLAPDSGFPVRRGVTLQPLDSSTTSEEKDNIPNVKISSVNLGNESSTETDTMDMDDFRNNQFSGPASSLLKKDALPSGRDETSSQLLSTKLPDVCHDPGVKDAALLAENMDTSTSKTESLDMEHFLPHVERPTSSRSSVSPAKRLGLEPSSKWVKRLKTSDLGTTVYSTMSSNMEEASCCDKTSSEPNTGKSRAKVHGALDQTDTLPGNVNSSSSESVRKEITLSHPWIQRWRRNTSTSEKRKPEPTVICEPQKLKVTDDDLRKKQFPSIAAMALMGKSMNGFRPCEFKKRGSFVVWNHNDY